MAGVALLSEAASAQQEAPTGAATPAGAHIETLGASMQVEPTQMYKVKAVATALDVSAATIYRAVESGALEAVRVGTGKGAVRIPEEAVKDYIAKCKRAAATSRQRESLVAEDHSCVICGADFRSGDVDYYPVGRSDSGSTVYACKSHQDLSLAGTTGGAA